MEAARAQVEMYELFTKKKARPHAPLTSDRDRCSNPDGLATFSQAVVYEACKQMASSSRRGLAVIHSTGTGKTCAAVAAMSAFWSTPRQFVYCTTRDSLRSVEQPLLVKCARAYFPELAAVPNFDAALEQRLTRITMTQLAHQLQLVRPRQVRDEEDRASREVMLNRSLLILDEVHNFFRPLPNHREEHLALLKLLLSDDARTRDTKIVLMTATPGANPTELVSLLNIVRDRSVPEIRVPRSLEVSDLREWGASILGLVSYIDASRDSSVFPRLREERVDCFMSWPQYNKYLEKVAATPEEEMDFDRLQRIQDTGKYWRTARKYANSQFDLPEGAPLTDLSCKLVSLLSQVISSPQQKHYVYSSFHTRAGWGGHGVHMCARALQGLGYRQLTVEDAAQIQLPARRYIVMTTSELVGTSDSSERERTAVASLLRVFNSPENSKGQLVHVMLASQNYNEALDLHDVRHVHLLEPQVAVQAETQAIGRAVRRCSHRNLRKGDWTVTAWRYFALPPVELPPLTDQQAGALATEAQSLAVREQQARGAIERSYYGEKLAGALERLRAAHVARGAHRVMVDDVIYREARERAREMEVLTDVIKRGAIDCILTREFHGMQKRCLTQPA